MLADQQRTQNLKLLENQHNSKMKYFLCINLFILSLLVFGCQTKPAEVEVPTTVNKFGEINSEAPPETKQFGQLVGNWACSTSNLQPDSTWKEGKANWEFRYTLDGFAIEDVWNVKAEDQAFQPLGRDFTGINYRIYDPKQKKWFCVWIENRANTMTTRWEATHKEGQITMHDGTGKWRIVFFDISENVFHWKYELKQADDSWKVVSKILGKKT